MPFRPDSPVELPNGGLVCKDHHLKICGICTVDYSFMDEDDIYDEPDDDNDIDDSDDDIGEFPNTLRFRFAPSPYSVNTEPVIPGKYKPPRDGDSPQTLFPAGWSTESSPPVLRFIHASDPKQFLIFTDGACLNNGQANPRAGCSFVFRPSTEDPRVVGHTDFRLENKGPTGEMHQQTSNRAELRAVISALRFRAWSGEGCSTLIIATDSEYVVEGATSWIRGWLRRDWKTSTGAIVKNRDLWEALLDAIKEHDRWRMDVKFWRIPREWNTEADRYARLAAARDETEEYENVIGLLV
ncbi:ribonuclease H-like domain-containing protein [Aspergillus lucknowensis]|uniref:ribonuclease H n=1 Tax=Aspergillus lucknowensis TaxID=176173 RepID=A0ABR4LFA0_9EURO